MNDTVKILIVDDHPKNLVAMTAALSDLKAEIITAASGADALRAILEHEFAVVVLDVQMPGLNGFETAQLIRKHERARSTPIIFVTAMDSDHTSMIKAFDLGAVDFILKPIYSAAIIRAKVSVFVDLFVARRNEETLRRQREELSYDRLSETPVSDESANTTTSTIQLDIESLQTTLIDDYKTTINLALEQRVFEVDHKISQRLRNLAEIMGHHNFRPRAVIDVHRKALAQLGEDDNPKRRKALAEEGWFLILELMGHLVTYYRDLRHADTHSAAEGKDERPQ